MNGSDEVMEDIKPAEDAIAMEDMKGVEAAEEKVEAKADTRGEKLFSSDDFKIEVQNLPKYFGVGQLKKLFNNKLKLNTHKLKPCGPKTNYMYICFKNEEDKAKALDVINGFTFKGNKLRAKDAKFVDPFKKQQQVVRTSAPVDPRPLSVKLQDAVCPLARQTYEEQLANKQNEVLTLMKRLGSDVSRQGGNPIRPWVQRRCDEFGTIAPVQNFLRSPVTSGYRNKCEFTIGYQNVAVKEEKNGEAMEVEEKEQEDEVKEEEKDSEKEVSVGFRLASYKAGSVEVVSMSSLDSVEDTLPQISQQMVKVVLRLEQFVRKSIILPYCTLTRTGNWRHLLLRTARGARGAEEEGPGQVMAVVVMDAQHLSSEVLAQVRADLEEYFRSGLGGDAGVTSLFLHLAPARKEAGVSDPSPELLFGAPCIQENLLGRTFNISPEAFFQVNTLGAEVLYKTVGDIADLNKKTSLVDVCCGTGTIGLTLADRVGQVVGVEMVQEAVRDAIKNAEENKVTNCKFFAGKAEDILGNILRDVDSKEVVAIVDPPRAGLHPRALAAIRNTTNIKRLVYVSCDAKNAMKNFVDLARPASKTAHGDPFMPSKVIPVDLFPHSRGFELVILFERVPWGQILNSELNKRLAEEEKEGLNELVNQAELIKQQREEKERQEKEGEKEEEKEEEKEDVKETKESVMSVETTS